MAGVCETVGTQEHSDRACAAACHSLARPYLDLLIRGHCFRGRTNSFDLEMHATLRSRVRVRTAHGCQTADRLCSSSRKIGKTSPTPRPSLRSPASVMSITDEKFAGAENQRR